MVCAGHKADDKFHLYQPIGTHWSSQPYPILMIVRYEKAGVIGLLDNAGHLILAQVRLNEQTMGEVSN